MSPLNSSTTGNQQKPAVVCVFCASGPGKNPIHLASARRLAQCLHVANISLVYGGGTKGIMGELARSLVELYGSGGGSGGESGSGSRIHGVIPRALLGVDPEYTSNEDGKGENGVQKVSEDDAGTGDSAAAAATSKGPERDTSISTLATGSYGTVSIVPDMHTRKQQMAQLVSQGGVGSGFVALAGGYGTVEEVMEMVTWNQLGIHGMPIVLVNVDGYWDGLLAWVRNAVRQGFVSEGNADILVEVKDPDEVVRALREYRVSGARFQLDWSQG